MSKLKVWLIRHGETTVNCGLWSATPNKAQLTLNGLKQAEIAANQIIEKPDLFIVSPLIRAQQSAEFFIRKWPETPIQTLAIEEFVYLSPKRLSLLKPEEISIEINNYWLHADPDFCDGEDTESFRQFMQRIANFHTALLELQGYVVVIGHGQFFKAFQLALEYGFIPDSLWMQRFRDEERCAPLINGESVQYIF